MNKYVNLILIALEKTFKSQFHVYIYTKLEFEL